MLSKSDVDHKLFNLTWRCLSWVSWVCAWGSMASEKKPCWEETPPKWHSCRLGDFCKIFRHPSTDDLPVLMCLMCSHGNTTEKLYPRKEISTSLGAVKNISGIMEVGEGLRNKTDVNIGKLMFLKILEHWGGGRQESKVTHWSDLVTRIRTIASKAQRTDTCSSCKVSLMLSGADLAFNSQSPSNWIWVSWCFREICKKMVDQSKGVDHTTSRHSLQILPMKKGVTACLLL